VQKQIAGATVFVCKGQSQEEIPLETPLEKGEISHWGENYLQMVFPFDQGMLGPAQQGEVGGEISREPLVQLCSLRG